MPDTEYLFHYTNVEALALILKNRTIRFSSLDRMDDLQEKESSDLQNAGQFCYVSSWTDDVSESIPMWNMYASMNYGVRIKLRKFPFKRYKINPLDPTSRLVTDKNGNIAKDVLIPISDMLKNHFVCPQAAADTILHQMEYTNKQNCLYPGIYSSNERSATISFDKLGKHKNLHWAFQHEWRYILHFFPMDLNKPIATIEYEAQLMFDKIRRGIEKQPFPYYDMVIEDDAFSEMEITLSPQISYGSKVIVQTLIEKFNPSAALNESCLVGLI